MEDISKLDDNVEVDNNSITQQLDEADDDSTNNQGSGRRSAINNPNKGNGRRSAINNPNINTNGNGRRR